MTKDLDIIILAAGLGTRMKSDTIKILHRAAGRPIIDYVLDLASEISDRPPVMVVGHQRDAVQQAVGTRARFAVQEPQLGTGHAVLQALPLCSQARVLILSGDVPLTRPETLARLASEHAGSGDEPYGPPDASGARQRVEWGHSHFWRTVPHVCAALQRDGEVLGLERLRAAR